jgi:hypothetical protein
MVDAGARGSGRRAGRKARVSASTAEWWRAALGSDRAVYVQLLAEDSEGDGDERRPEGRFEDGM